MLAREFELCGLAWARPRALDVRLLAGSSHRLSRSTTWNDSAHARWDIEGLHTAFGDAYGGGKGLSCSRADVTVRMAFGPLLKPRLPAWSLLSVMRAARGGFFVTEPRAELAATGGVKLDTFAYRHLVSDVMSAPAVVVPSSLLLRDAIEKLIASNLSSVFVEFQDGDFGIVTERDALRAIHEDRDAAGKPIGAIARSPLLGVAHDDFGISRHRPDGALGHSASGRRGAEPRSSARSTPPQPSPR